MNDLLKDIDIAEEKTEAEAPIQPVINTPPTTTLYKDEKETSFYLASIFIVVIAIAVFIIWLIPDFKPMIDGIKGTTDAINDQGVGPLLFVLGGWLGWFVYPIIFIVSLIAKAAICGGGAFGLIMIMDFFLSKNKKS